MTENDKNDLKVPRFDSLNQALSRDTRIKGWTQAVKCTSLSLFVMKGASLLQTLYNGLSEWTTLIFSSGY
jgi:hypothetical protein